MSTALKRFSEAGARRLDDLEEPECSMVAAKLHNKAVSLVVAGMHPVHLLRLGHDTKVRLDGLEAWEFLLRLII
jgi:hypothetical protein